MNPIRRWLVWLSRIHHCRGFGIQSPTDYAFVRYVVNEHWPYYAYGQLRESDWLRQKLGRLYFRLANWRQPEQMEPDSYQRYWQAGCRKLQFTADANLRQVQLAHIDIDDQEAWQRLVPACNAQSVVVVEGLYRNWPRWHALMHDEHAGTTFDLYYCGIILFDKQRYSHHYIINF